MKLRLILSLILLLTFAAGAQMLGPAIMSKPPSGGGGSFPVTAILDNTTRADESPLSDGAKWTCPMYNGDAALQLSTNQIIRIGISDGDCYWNNATFGPKTEVYATVATVTGTGCIHLLLRGANPGLATLNGYIVQYCNLGSNQWDIYKIVSGTFTSIVTASGTISSGDGIGFSATSTTLTGYKRVSGTWSSTITVTDSTYTGAGNIGIHIEGSAFALTSIGGGTAP